MSSIVTHIGFADESNWNTGRFRSLGMVTLPMNFLEVMEREVRQLLRESQIREFKWKNLGGARERFAAEKLCQWTVEKACAGQLRVDVMVWDIKDRRHTIANRDDIANLERMYYHLFHNVLRARWPNDAVWKLCPDEHTALDMKTIKECLKNVSARENKINPSVFHREEFGISLRQEFGIEEIQEVSSDKNPLIQIADLFAGLAVFSHNKYKDYQEWLNSTSPQLSFPKENKDTGNPSGTSKERFCVLEEFDKMCKKRKLCVSLKTKQGLWTPDPKNPINFWIYESQHPKDKAPQKKGR